MHGTLPAEDNPRRDQHDRATARDVAMGVPTESVLAIMAVRVSRVLLQKQLHVVTAESCTGGYLAKLFTDIPGSSRWFDCGFVCYSNAAKVRDLEVQVDTLRQHGAVSGATVAEMALGALVRTGADRSVAIRAGWRAPMAAPTCIRSGRCASALAGGWATGSMCRPSSGGLRAAGTRCAAFRWPSRWNSSKARDSPGG